MSNTPFILTASIATGALARKDLAFTKRRRPNYVPFDRAPDALGLLCDRLVPPATGDSA